MAGNGDVSGTSITGGGGAAPPSGQQPPPQGDIKAAGPKIQVDFAEANQALAHLDEAFRTLDDALNGNRVGLMGVTGPGTEQPSKTFAKNFHGLASQELTNLTNQRDAIKTMYDTLKAQLGSQANTEQTNASNLNANS